MTQLQTNDSFIAKSRLQQGEGCASNPTALPAKGSCWYCDKPVDNVRRFCSLSCRNDYQEEESEFPKTA